MDELVFEYFSAILSESGDVIGIIVGTNRGSYIYDDSTGTLV